MLFFIEFREDNKEIYKINKSKLLNIILFFQLSRKKKQILIDSIIKHTDIVGINRTSVYVNK